MKKYFYVAMLLFGASLLSISCQKEGKYGTAIVGKWRLTLSEEYNENGIIQSRDIYGTDSYKYEWYVDGKIDDTYTQEPKNQYLQFDEDGNVFTITDIRTRSSTYEVNGSTLTMAGDSFEIKKLTKRELVYYERDSDRTEWWEYFERVE